MKIEAHGEVFELRPRLLEDGYWVVHVVPMKVRQGVLSREHITFQAAHLDIALREAGEWLKINYPKTLEPVGHDFAWAVERIANNNRARFRDWGGGYLGTNLKGELCRFNSDGLRVSGIRPHEAKSTDGWVLA